MANTSFPSDIEDINSPPVRAWTDEIRRAATGAEVLQKFTAVSDTSIDIFGLKNKYILYTIQMFNLLPATDDVELHVRMDSSSGLSFDSGASDYMWVNLTKSVSGTTVTEETLGDDADAQIVLTSTASTRGIGSAANEGISGEIKLYAPLESNHTQMSFQGTYKNADGEVTMYSGSGIYLNVTATNAVQLLFSSGNVTSGEVRLLGSNSTRG